MDERYTRVQFKFPSLPHKEANLLQALIFCQLVRYTTRIRVLRNCLTLMKRTMQIYHNAGFAKLPITYIGQVSNGVGQLLRTQMLVEVGGDHEAGPKGTNDHAFNTELIFLWLTRHMDHYSQNSNKQVVVNHNKDWGVVRKKVLFDMTYGWGIHSWPSHAI